MTLVQQGGTSIVTPKLVAVLAACAVLGAALYAVGVLMPYYVNDLDSLPLQEVTSGHDPKDLWPQGPLGGLVQLAGLLSLALTPLTLVGVALISGGALLYGRFRSTERPSLAVALALRGIVAACCAGLAFVGSPTGNALFTWRLD